MTKPPPFKRPSVDMDRTGRTWQNVKAKQLTAGDVVADRGLIDETHFYGRAQQVEVTYKNGETDILEPDEKLFAFVRKVEIDGEDGRS
jgi:hypothetical protein